MTAGAAKRLESVQQPLALHPVGAIPVADGIALLEDEDGAGSVFIWGQAAWAWGASDSAARRLCAVQLVNADAADQRAVAASFGVNETTVWRWRNDYSGGGVSALLPQIHGPKGPSKLTEEKCAEIQRLRAEGKTIAEAAKASGVSTFTVRRALAPVKAPSVPAEPADPENGLIPLNQPAGRSAERQAARRGVLEEAAPAVTEGASLPLVGALVILPALFATGLLEAAASIYGQGRRVGNVKRAAFYGLRSLILTVVFSCLIGEPRAASRGPHAHRPRGDGPPPRARPGA